MSIKIFINDKSSILTSKIAEKTHGNIIYKIL